MTEGDNGWHNDNQPEVWGMEGWMDEHYPPSFCERVMAWFDRWRNWSFWGR